MYGLLANITERINGKASWEELMTAKIFRPLGMTSSTFTHTADITRKDIAQPYLLDNGTYRALGLEMHK